ncbi:hypothetical protein HLX14_004078 [Escherichia coli]|nr:MULTISPECIES: hypothetical protein [Edwardsiella]EFP0183611.1 hypothetical protein [Escherichia coli]EGA8339572.1 hypothetical protein [Salmonella enterica subsp. enterica serovar Saintpaul]EKG9744538.1 hypothetical protein [Salmonella enterica]KAB0589143.1 hypothetical protein F7P84_15265 [Edwardsiella anguillarum]EKS7763300.1 hypothetical protein [Edwardsiella ictaluri]
MSDGKWDGKISNLNISEQSFPELYHELSQMQHKTRSDRLRALALLGLYSLRLSGNMVPLGHGQPSSTVQQPEIAQDDKKLSSQRGSLKNKLMGSV